MDPAEIQAMQWNVSLVRIGVCWLISAAFASMEAAEIAPPDIPGLEVSIGRRQVIIEDRTYPHMFKFADGDILVCTKRSGDGGKTWRDAPALTDSVYQFPDGQVTAIGFLTKKSDRPGVFHIPLVTSTDNGATLHQGTAIMNIPEGTGGIDDGGKPFDGPACDHAVVALRDGSLLAGMYGYFRTDTVRVAEFPQWNIYKYRTFVVRSCDRGKTWDYLATVAYDPTIGQESFCEPDLLVLPDGEILCFMRTGGNAGKFTPLYLSRSADDGKTWSKPEPVADRGVWPNACRMKNGVIVCTYGRPDSWLMFSLDDGKTWTGHFCFHKGQGPDYNLVEEVAPDTLLVIHNHRRDADDKYDVMGLNVTVRRR